MERDGEMRGKQEKERNQTKGYSGYQLSAAVLTRDKKIIYNYFDLDRIILLGQHANSYKIGNTRLYWYHLVFKTLLKANTTNL